MLSYAFLALLPHAYAGLLNSCRSEHGPEDRSAVADLDVGQRTRDRWFSQHCYQQLLLFGSGGHAEVVEVRVEVPVEVDSHRHFAEPFAVKLSIQVSSSQFELSMETFCLWKPFVTTTTKV